MYILPTLTYLEVGGPADASKIIRYGHFKWEPIRKSPANVVLVVLKAHSVECEEKADSFFAVGLKQINSDSTSLLSFGPLPLPPSRQPI